jgi:peroxiredoxin Q/BCP
MRYIEFLRRVLRPLEMLGKPVPDFSPVCTGATTATSIPRTTPPCCTTEGAEFRDLHGQKIRFPFELLSDADEALCKQFGKKVRGTERSTFAVDAKGVLAREWRGVKVPGHAQEVLNFVKAL